MRKKDSELEKQKAILQQKVELLQLQLQESQDREQNLKKMHETMMNALQNEDESSQYKTPREVEIATQMHKRDLQDMKQDMESKIKELKQQCNDKDTENKDLQIQIEQLEIDQQRKLQELELDKRQLENKIKKLQHENNLAKKQQEQYQNHEDQSRNFKDEIDNLNYQNEKLKTKHETEIQNLRESFKKEKQSLKEQIDDYSDKLQKNEYEFKTKIYEITQEKDDKYQKEVNELQNQIQDLQRKNNQELKFTIKERDELAEKALSLEKELDKLKSAPKPVTVHLSQENIETSRSTKQENYRLREDNNYLSQQVKQQKEQINELRYQIAEQEQNERTLKRDIQSKANEIDNQDIDYQRKINEERRKYATLEEEYQQSKIQFEKKKNEMLNHINDKDTIIDELRQESQDLNNPNLNSISMQSPIPQNVSMTVSRDFQMGYNILNGQRSQSPKVKGQENSQYYKTNQSPTDHQKNNFKNQKLFQKYQPRSQQRNQIDMVKKSQSQYLQKRDHSTNGTTQTSQNQTIQQHGIKTHGISNTQLKLYQSCQKMVDAAIRMECAQCMQVFLTTEFYDHIISQQNCLNYESNTYQNNYPTNKEDITMCLEEEYGYNNNQVMYESNQNFHQTIYALQNNRISKNRNQDSKISDKDQLAQTHCSQDFQGIQCQQSKNIKQKQKKQYLNEQLPLKQNQQNPVSIESQKQNSSVGKLLMSKQRKQFILDTQSSQEENRNKNEQQFINEFLTCDGKDQNTSNNNLNDSVNLSKRIKKQIQEQVKLKFRENQQTTNIDQETKQEQSSNKNSKRKVKQKQPKNINTNKENYQQHQEMKTCRANLNQKQNLQYTNQNEDNEKNTMQDCQQNNQNANQVFNQQAYVLESFRAFKKAPVTTKKCGDRYNALLQSSPGSSNSIISPRNLKFGQQKKSSNKMNINISNFESNKRQQNKDQQSYKNSSPNFIVESQKQTSDYNYSSDGQQNNLEYENNYNDLMSPDSKKNYLSKVDQFVEESEAPISGIQSSRHHGTHELVPNLIASQESKFPHQTSQNNLVIYDSQRRSEENNYTNQNTTSRDQQKFQQNSQSQKILNSNNTMKSQQSNKEQKQYVIRESCPEPLGENEIVDDVGDPFEPMSATQNNLSNVQTILSQSGILLSAKQPHYHQDQVVHILPQPKFIQTLPMMRMRSITEMNDRKQ